jgi:hypothetical protein
MLRWRRACDAVERRSWSHPQEPTGEAWWADGLPDPRARSVHSRDLRIKQAFYRLRDKPRDIILVACSMFGGQHSARTNSSLHKVRLADPARRGKNSNLSSNFSIVTLPVKRCPVFPHVT